MKTVVTHSGKFHPDDVFAIATLQIVHGADNIKVIRSRDEGDIKAADIVVDVGLEYDVAKQRFDHHQSDPSLVRANKIPYAAFGLIWREYGAKICGDSEIADRLERHLVLPIDAGDNAVRLYDLKEYGVTPFELFNVINSFRPNNRDRQELYDSFMEAVDFARKLLLRLIKQTEAQIEADRYVESVYNSTEDKRMLIFDRSINRQAISRFPETLLIVYESSSEGAAKWRAETVPNENDAFSNRVLFPSNWAEDTSDTLENVSGIKGLVFCHKGRFLCSGLTEESVLAAAKQALEQK